MRERWAAEILDRVMVPSFKKHHDSYSVNDIIERKRVDDVIDVCTGFCHLADESEVTKEEVTEAWKDVFHDVWVKWLGFSDRDVDSVFDELVYGNWKRLHKTEIEENLSSSYWLDEFRCDVFCCSDRWSLDRLTRCHWLYRNYVRAWDRENETNNAQ